MNVLVDDTDTRTPYGYLQSFKPINFDSTSNPGSSTGFNIALFPEVDAVGGIEFDNPFFTNFEGFLYIEDTAAVATTGFNFYKCTLRFRHTFTPTYNFISERVFDLQVGSTYQNRVTLPLSVYNSTVVLTKDSPAAQYAGDKIKIEAWLLIQKFVNNINISSTLGLQLDDAGVHFYQLRRGK